MISDKETICIILRDHARQLLAHIDDPAADVVTLVTQAEQTAALARAELDNVGTAKRTDFPRVSA